MILSQSIFLLGQLFSQPMYVPTKAISLLWALPICFSIAIVYKSVKIEEFKAGLFIREVLLLFITIIGFLIMVSLILLAIAKMAHQI